MQSSTLPYQKPRSKTASFTSFAISANILSYKGLKAFMAGLKARCTPPWMNRSHPIFWTSLLRDGTRSILKSLSPGGITGLILAPILYFLNTCSWKVIFSKRDNVYIYFDFIHLISPCTLDLSIPCILFILFPYCMFMDNSYVPFL